MSMKDKTTATPKARADRRYKNPNDAPAIMSEKRLTFFLPDDTFRALRRQTGYFQVANASDESDAPTELPATPSALVREAIDFWLDQFRDPSEQIRSKAEWEARLNRLRKALKN